MAADICEHIKKLILSIGESGVILVGIESFICPNCPEVVIASRDSNNISLTKINLGPKKEEPKE